MKYRPDIDGLRAVAVLSVVGYHALPGVVPGGFVGVDVFFVISGYLISTIILREQDEARFSLINFYARRIKRLFPALIVVLGATALMGWYYLLPHEFRSFGKHMMAGAAYFLNFTLKKEAGYFDASAAEKPLLHLWSLAVEEQFYIVWPVLLLLLAGRGRTLAVLALITVASLGMSLIAIHRNSAAAFYLPQNRFWELSSGALLAFGHLYGSQWQLNSLVRHVVSIAGLALILGAVLLLDAQVIYPGAWALIPCMGALFVIGAGPDAFANKWLMSLPAMVFIGLISYPLYLWHWPLLSFSSILGFGGDAKVRLATVALAAVLAYLTYRFLERPLRHAQSSAIPVGLLVATLSFCLAGALASKSALHPHLNDPQHRDIGDAIEDWQFSKGLRRVNAHSGVLIHEAGTGTNKVLYFGDSNMQQYWPRIERRMSELKDAPSVIFVTGGGCFPIPGAVEDHHPNCLRFAETAIDVAKDPAIKTIVIGAFWYGYFNNSQYHIEGSNGGPLNVGTPAWNEAFSRLARMIGDFTAAGKSVWIVLNMPSSEELAPRFSFRRSISGSTRLLPRQLDRAMFESGWAPIRSKLMEVAAASGANVIDPMSSLCDKVVCPGRTADGVLIYKDGGHLRSSYVRGHAAFMDVTLEIARQNAR